MIYVVTGQTLAGKDTLVRDLVTATGIKRIVTYTTRPKRENEIDGKDYHFITNKEMNTDKFFGRRDFYTVYRTEPYSYAMSKDDFLPYEDKIVISDPKGLKEIKDQVGHQFVISVYIDTPEQLIYDRGKKRGDSYEEIKRRLDVDRPLFSSAKYYADIVINSEKDDMLAKMYDVLRGR